MPDLRSGPPAIVAGAGIGGLAAALFLSRAGIPSLVLERRTVLDEAGAGIQLSPNASRLLIALGLGPALTRRAVAPERVDIRDARSGRTIGGIALGASMQERYGAPYWVLHRADLHGVLLDAVRSDPNVTLKVGRAVRGAMEAGDGVAVSVERGASQALETLHAPFVIGADGVRSACRAALGDVRAPVYQGADAWRTTIPVGEAPAFAREPVTGLWLGKGLHVVHYPVCAGRAVNVVAVLAADAPLEDYGTPGEPGRIAARVSRLAGPLRDLVAAAADWRVWSLKDLPAERMARGRIALAGDAAHPVLPYLAQGGAMAIEDAATLASALARQPWDVPAALAAYEGERLARVRRVQDAARGNGRIYHLGAPFTLARNAVIARRGPESMRNAYDWLYGWTPPA